MKGFFFISSLSLIVFNKWTFEYFILNDNQISSILLNVLVFILNFFGILLLFLYFILPNKENLFKFTYNFILSIIIALFLLETSVRIFFKNLLINDRIERIFWPANYSTILTPDSLLLPGVRNESIFTTSSIHARSREILPNDSIKIIALGGSTTECLYLDQNETWTALLEKKLNLDSFHFWVGNFGKSGLSIIHNIEQLNILPINKKYISIVIVLVGNNDLMTFLKHGLDHYREGINYENEFYFNSATYLLLKKTNNLISVITKKDMDLIQDSRGEIYKKWREYRQSADLIYNLPFDLSDALLIYKQRIKKLITLCKNANLSLLLVSQPVLYTAQLDDYSSSLVWAGGKGEFQKGKAEGYFSIESLEKGINQFNRVLIETAMEENVYFLDAASQLPKDTSVFYDDCHFNEAGSEKLAQLIYDKITSSIFIK